MEKTLLELEKVTEENIAELFHKVMEEAMQLGPESATVALSVTGGMYYYYYVPIVQNPFVNQNGEQIRLSLTTVEAVNHALGCIKAEMADRIWRQRKYYGKEASSEYRVKVYYHPKSR